MGDYLVVPRGYFMGQPSWHVSEDDARAAALRISKKSKSPRCKVSRVSLDGVEHIANYKRGKEVTA